MSTDQRITVQIVHEDALLAAGLRAILSVDSELTVVDGTASSELEFLGRPLSAPVAVVVADYHTGLQLARRSRARAAFQANAEPRVLVFTSQDSEGDIRQALQAGAYGYLVQGCTTAEVVCAIKVVGRGLRYFSPTVSQRMADTISHVALTGREAEVLELLSQGQSNKLIARELGVATGRRQFPTSSLPQATLAAAPGTASRVSSVVCPPQTARPH